MKTRIDQLLVERGLAGSREKAQALILAGQVLVDGQKADKAGRRVEDDAVLEVVAGERFASRAGAKLEAALEHFGIRADGRICADLGASTGGFTDCLLQRGAREVHAFDVGRGQLDWKLRNDPRVRVRDAFNVRYIRGEDLPAGISLVVIDVSFISVTKILGPLRAALAGRGAGVVDVVILVKPQFEVGKGEVGKGGIVREPEKRAAALAAVEESARSEGYAVVGSLESPVAGAHGNQEFLLYLQLSPGLRSAP